MKKYYDGLDTTLPIQRIFMGDVSHEIIVTRVNPSTWGVRCFTNGILNQEIQVHTRGDIGRAAREMLRTEEKCGNISQFAGAARDRIVKPSNKVYIPSIKTIQ
jgi:hypothetical protein